MPTPESRTKARIKKVLDQYGCYWYMPVLTGFGKQDREAYI